MHAAIHSNESTFHDQWAASTDPRTIAVAAAFEAPTAVENRYILQRLGSLEGVRLLDVGCGLGESSVYFAQRGAKVTATDISPGMIATALRLAELHGVEIDTFVTPAEDMDLPREQFDVVYSANTLHHVTDRDAFLRCLHRALRPGGRIFTWDPLAYNPIINIYRRMATGVRTADEQPLRFADLKRFSRYFVDVRHREFWFLSLSLFLKYFLIDRIHPNAERYWKKIYSESTGLWWWKPLRNTDAALMRIPLLRRLAWNIVIHAEKASS